MANQLDEHNESSEIEFPDSEDNCKKPGCGTDEPHICNDFKNWILIKNIEKNSDAESFFVRLKGRNLCTDLAMYEDPYVPNLYYITGRLNDKIKFSQLEKEVTTKFGQDKIFLVRTLLNFALKVEEKACFRHREKGGLEWDSFNVPIECSVSMPQDGPLDFAKAYLKTCGHVDTLRRMKTKDNAVYYEATYRFASEALAAELMFHESNIGTTKLKVVPKVNPMIKIKDYFTEYQKYEDNAETERKEINEIITYFKKAFNFLSLSPKYKRESLLSPSEE